LHPRLTVILSMCYIRQITQTKTNNLAPSIVHCVGSFVITFSLAKNVITRRDFVLDTLVAYINVREYRRDKNKI